MDASQHTPVVMNLSSPTRIGRTCSVALTGMRGQIVSVEADIGNTCRALLCLAYPINHCRKRKTESVPQRATAGCR